MELEISEIIKIVAITLAVTLAITLMLGLFEPDSLAMYDERDERPEDAKPFVGGIDLAAGPNVFIDDDINSEEINVLAVGEPDER